MSVSVFTGCSYTAGDGFTLEKHDPALWVNILHSANLYLKGSSCVNLGKSGGANEDIFHISIDALFEHNPEYMFVEWTEYPRYTILLGIETYATTQVFTPNSICVDHNLHNINYTSTYLKNIRDRFFSLHHPHQGILNIVKYTNALINIAKTTGTKIFFINGMCSWDRRYFDFLTDVLPDSYTPYTQKLLDCDTRSDEEIYKLYEFIHSEYRQAGSIQQNYWLNLNDSLRASRIDVNQDNIHPGIQSNQNYANLLNQALLKQLGS
jgi:hypothetical protein